MFEVEKIREDFPILEREINGYPLVYLDNAATTQKPKQVIEAIVDYYENHNANVHRGIHTLSEEATSMVENARLKIARFIGSNDEKEIIFVRNASEAINLVMYSWGEKNIGKGDEVVVSLMEHHSNLVTWQMLCQKKGAVLRVVDVDGEGEIRVSGGEMREFQGVRVMSLEQALGAKTKLVAMTAVSNVLGTVSPLEKIVKMVRTKTKAKILIDGSQSVPVMKTEVGKMGVDWLVFSGHKMLGPTGVGVLWGRREILEEMPPFLYGGDMIGQVELGKSEWNELPWKFEAGTPNMAGMVGLGAAVDYLEDLGMNEVWKHEQDLVAYALEKIKGKAEVYGTGDYKKRAGVITFNLPGIHAHDTAQVLDGFGIAIRSGQHCGAPVVESLGEMAVARASVYVYNTRAEIDYLIDKLFEVKKVFRKR